MSKAERDTSIALRNMIPEIFVSTWERNELHGETFRRVHDQLVYDKENLRLLPHKKIILLRITKILVVCGTIEALFLSTHLTSLILVVSSMTLMIIAANIGLLRLEEKIARHEKRLDTSESKIAEFEKTVCDLRSLNWLDEAPILTADSVVEQLTVAAAKILELEDDFNQIRLRPGNVEGTIRLVIGLLDSHRGCFRNIWQAAEKFGVVLPHDKQRVFGMARRRLDDFKPSKQS